MREELRITGPRYKEHRPPSKPRATNKTGVYLVWVFPTNYGSMTFREMGTHTGIPAGTIATRISRDGWDADGLFDTEDHPTGGNYGRFLPGKPKRNPESINVGIWEMANL